MRDLREYLVINDSRRQMMHKHVELLQQTRACHAISGRKQLHHTWHDSFLVVGFVEQSPELEHRPKHHRAGVSVVVSCYQLRQNLVATNVVGKIVKHRRQRVEEANLLSLIFDLNLFEKQKRID